MLYFKSDGLLYSRDTGGTIRQVGAGAAPANMMTTDTQQNVSGTKDFNSISADGANTQLGNNAPLGRAYFRRPTGTVMANPTVVIQRTATQTGDMLQVIDESATPVVLSRISSTGAVYDGTNRVYSAANPPPGSPLGSTYTFAAALSTYPDLQQYAGYATTANGWPVAGLLSGFRNGTTGTQRLQSDSTGQTWARYWTGAAWGAFSLYVDSQDFAAKGSVQVGTANNTFAELLVGTAGQTQIVDLATATGLKYASIAEPYIFAVTGALTVATGKSRIYMEAAYAVETIRAAVNTSPAGASVLVDVNKNGTTLFTTQANRPTIAAAGNLSTVLAPDVTTFAAGDYLTVDVDQIGSTTAGSDLTVTVRLRRI